jgi:hypothetical protein
MCILKKTLEAFYLDRRWFYRERKKERGRYMYNHSGWNGMRRDEARRVEMAR